MSSPQDPRLPEEPRPSSSAGPEGPRLLNDLREEFLAFELSFARELLLLARRSILENGPYYRTTQTPAFLLSQGWERLIKCTLFLHHLEQKRSLPPPTFFRQLGHDVKKLKDGLVSDVLTPAAKAHGIDIDAWTTDGDWLWETLNAYAKGGRYFGLDQLLTKGGSENPLPYWYSKEFHDHPENIWFSFYDVLITDHGLATGEEIDDDATEPAFGRVNVRLASLTEDQLAAVVAAYETGYLGSLGRKMTKRLRFARWTSYDI